MTIYKGFDINDATALKPWGVRENQAWKDDIDTLVIGTIQGAADATNGHQHNKLHSSLNVVGVFVQAETGYVGIDTVDPDALLHVYNNSEIAVPMVLIEQEDSLGDTTLSWLLTGGQQFTMGIDNSDSDKFKICDSAVLGTNTRLTIDNSGNVGINTDIPIGQLNVQQKTDVILDGMYITSSDGYSGGFYRDATSPGAFHIRNNNIDTISLKGGNVGIGTDSPQYKVDFGDPTSGGNDIGWGKLSTSKLATIGSLRSSGSLFLGKGIESDNSNNERLNYTTVSNIVKSSIVFYTDGIIFSTKPAAVDVIGNEFAWETTYNRMVIDSSGNVGVGVESPDLLLDIAKSNASSTLGLRTYDNSDFVGSELYLDKSHTDTIGTLVETIDTEDLGKIFFRGVNSSSARTSGAGLSAVQNGAAGSYVPADLIFLTADAEEELTERMRIDKAGHVGINTIPDSNWPAYTTTGLNSLFDMLSRDGSNISNLSLYGFDSAGYFSHNVYYDDSDWRSTAGLPGTRIELDLGKLEIQISDAVAQDAIVTWAECFTILQTAASFNAEKLTPYAFNVFSGTDQEVNIVNTSYDGMRLYDNGNDTNDFEILFQKKKNGGNIDSNTDVMTLRAEGYVGGSYTEIASIIANYTTTKNTLTLNVDSTDQVVVSDELTEINGSVEVNEKIKLTPEGGVAIKLTNKTEVSSVKGTLVDCGSGVDNSFNIAGADAIDCIGAIYEDGVADGSECWVVVSGIAEVLLKDSTAATRDYWVKTSDTGGRADATNAAPPGGSVAALEEHAQEIGHALESQSSGTDVLCKIVMHLN